MAQHWTVHSEEATEVVKKLRSVRDRIGETTLIAVSKTKPLSMVAAAAHDGHRDFGENYIQELVEKAQAAAEDQVGNSLRWHFIGKIQSNKAKLLCSTPNLAAVHTIHNEKIASALDKHWPQEHQLNVFVQVNTSGEETKGGCEPSEAPALAKFVQDQCPKLHLLGLMCIGKYSGAEGDASPDFESLRQCRSETANLLGLDPNDLALSMGMSHDFEQAISFGATHVRVGSTIFGPRVYASAPVAEKAPTD